MEHVFLDNLTSFGLTRLEAQIYAALLTHGSMTGYEVAKDTGISRSNTYSALSALVEKGASFVIEGESVKYTPVEVKAFTRNVMSELTRKAEILEQHAPKKIIASDGYITIKGSLNIRNKIRGMIEGTLLRLYFQAPQQIIYEFDAELRNLVESDKKVVILTDEYKLHGAKIYKTKKNTNVAIIPCGYMNGLNLTTGRDMFRTIDKLRYIVKAREVL